MAFAVVDALRFKLGLRVPEDVSVAGFDDVPIAAWPAYNLTSYRQPINRMVGQTVEALMQRIEDPSRHAHRVKLEGALIRRESTAPAKR
jgi:DNA-binding LacI/PurR family transcriptional regulator